MGKEEVSSEAKGERKTKFSTSPGLPARLHKMKAALAFTSYQSNLLYLVGLKPDGGLNIHQTAIPKPMGLALKGLGGLLLSSGYQIMQFENVLQPEERVNKIFDACYVPRLVHVTGRLDAHDVGVGQDGAPLFINTRFNCLATTSLRHSFSQVWRPPFISALVDEDRCHLNGLAMESGVARYATAASQSDSIDGWRDRRWNGGVVIDIDRGKVVCEGLSMPHSPRIHEGRLWVLNSGTGNLGEVVFDGGGNGQFHPHVFCPGFLRGLHILGNVAIVGLSKPRYDRFEGLPLDQQLAAVDSDPWCGVQFIDLEKRVCVDWLRIDGEVAELYDIAMLPKVMCPMAVSPTSSEVAGLVSWDKAW